MKLSFEQIRTKLHDAIQPSGNTSVGDPMCWIEAVYEDEFVYHKGDKLYKAPYEIEDEGAVKIGPAMEVTREVEYEPVFSEAKLFTAFKESTERGTVVRRGKIFEAGDFPDKGVQFDDEDLDHAVKTFSPVDNDLEHASTILDGHLGKLQKVWKQGRELFGEVELPAWLDKLIGDEPIKTSLAFDKAKTIRGNALVLRPRIPDAAIMSAFSSVNKKGPEPEDTKPKMKLSEAIRHIFGRDIADPDAEVTLPAGVAATEPPTPTPAEATKPETEQVPVAAFSAAQERLAAMEGQLLKERAFAFADETIRSNKALPAQREQIATMFSQAVKADAGNGAMFSAENGLIEGAQVKAIRDYFAAAPTHKLSGEAIPNDAAVLLFGGSKSEGMSKERTTKLLEMSALGRKAAEASKN